MTVSKALTDPRRLRRFVAFLRPEGTDRVLDIAPGQGVLAAVFAPRVREVALLGEKAARPRRLGNVTTHDGLPQALPFPDEAFDIVTCGSSFHHLAEPRAALAEMARVCRRGGRLALEDIVASEQAARARYQNRLERLRDRSHPGYLRLSDYVSLLGEAGIPLRQALLHDLPREFNEWLIGARPSPQRVEHIRRLMVGAVESDLSGLNIRPLDDTVVFSQRLAWLVAEKPE